MSDELKAIESRIAELDRERADLIQRKQQLLEHGHSLQTLQILTSDQKLRYSKLSSKGERMFMPLVGKMRKAGVVTQ